MKHPPYIRIRALVYASALAGAFAFAVWVRLQYIIIYGGPEGYVEWASENYFGGITRQYLNLVNEILQAGSYAATSYPPGYPGLIALLHVLGIEDLQHLRVAQAVLDSTGVVAFFLLLRAAQVARSLSLLGSLIYAVYPLWAAGSTLLLAESLSPLLIVWILTMLAYAAKCRRRLVWAGTGLATGVAGMVRPDLLLLVGVALVWCFFVSEKSTRIGAMAALAVGFALPVGAWGVHNRIQHGLWLFTTTSGGAGLWEGLGALPNEHGYVLSDTSLAEMLRSKGLTHPSIEADEYLKRDYLRAWRDHPEHVFAVILFRWRNILWTSESFRPYVLGTLQQFLDRYGAWLSLIALVFVRRNPVALLLIAAPVVYALVSIGLVHWEPRYVRYVHIGYVGAILALLSRCLSALDIRSVAVGRAVGSTALLAFVALVLPGSSMELSRYRSNAELASQLPSRLARGELTPAPAFSSLDWSAIGAAKLVVSDDAVMIETAPGSSAYQASAGLLTGNVKAMIVTFELDIVEGGATVGVLGSDGRWLGNKSVAGPGRHRGTITAVVAPHPGVNLIVASNNSQHGVSRLALRELQIHFALEQ